MAVEPVVVGEVTRRLRALVAMARPAFLLGTVPLYAVGVAAAMREGATLRPTAAALGLATVWAVQAMTHYQNEHRDVAVDAGPGSRGGLTGGSGVLVEGALARRTARVAALASLILAMALAAAAVARLQAGAPFAAAVAVAAAAGWLYSTPPARLVGRGLGEVTVGVVAGGLVPAVGYLLQAPAPDAGALRVVPPLVVLAFATAVSTALPDVDADRAGGKRTLAVRLGRARAVVLDGAALAVGWLWLGAVLVPVVPTLGVAALVVLLVPLVGVAASARPAAAGSAVAARRVALAGVGCLGLASVVTVTVLLAG